MQEPMGVPKGLLEKKIFLYEKNSRIQNIFGDPCLILFNQITTRIN